MGMPYLSFLITIGLGLVESPVSGRVPAPIGWACVSPNSPRAERVVFLARGLSDQALISLTANVVGSNHPGIILLDSPKASAAEEHFLKLFQAERIVPVGSFPYGVGELERRLGAKAVPIVSWADGPPIEYWRVLFPRAPRVVVCSAQPRRLQLQAACLAGVLKAPFYVATGESEEEASQFRQLLSSWDTHEIVAVGEAANLCRDLGDIHILRFWDEEAVTASHLRHLRRQGPIRNIVVTNPSDGKPESALAPWIALTHQAPLLLTNDKGSNVGELIRAAWKKPALRQLDTMILAGDLTALPMERRPNPIAGGKDAEIEMEPLTPTGTEPFTLATGRLFSADPSMIPLMLARQRLVGPASSPVGKSLTGETPVPALLPRTAPRALVISNPTGGLPLLEAFSRNTTKEFLNCGYQTTALFGDEVNPDDLRALLPEQDIFLWEGHYSTLMKEYKMHEWTEPMRPALVFLQSCLALSEGKAQPFLERGALAVVGSSTRTYSGSGGACALAFFDPLLYENQSLGASLRQAKNFLLAYSLLKEKRLGSEAKLIGANLRSAWAFTLWGDPTLKLPPPEPPEDALPHVRHTIRGNAIVVHLPNTAHEKATSSKYKAQMLPNARLAGLLSKDADDDGKRLVPFIFFEIHLPKASPGCTPHLRSRLPDNHWVFCWDERRSCGYLLITPRSKDQQELRFFVDWNSSETVQDSNPKSEERNSKQIQMTE
jgi:hypothetical protein